jgi:uncharacterized protein YjbI with pentapeptide repeats
MTLKERISQCRTVEEKNNILREEDLSGADLSGADLRGAYPSGVKLQGARIAW